MTAAYPPSNSTPPRPHIYSAKRPFPLAPGLVARRRGSKPSHNATTTPKQHYGSGLGGFGAVEKDDCCVRVMCVACESRFRALTSHARPPQQPQGCACRSRAHTGAPHGVSGGASQGPAARQTRFDVTRPHPRSGRAVLDVTCAHNADAGEGKQGVEINFYARMHKKHAKDGHVHGWRCDECSRESGPNREEARV